MALPTSGPLSLNQIHIEAGGTSGTTVSLNDADVRALIGKASGATMSFSEWYGASGSVVINLTIAANTNNYNIQSARGGAYVAGATTVNVTINSGVTVGSTSTGTYALETGSSWASGDVINIINNGTVKGRGANGGAGCSVSSSSPNNPGATITVVNGGNGGTGGNAFRAQFATSFTNNGSVYGGGGGGGGGGGYASDFKNLITCQPGAGGGGGAGVNVGTGGAAGVASGGNTNAVATAGSNGTATAGGAGGAGSAPPNGDGGNGGGLGADGVAGNPNNNLIGVTVGQGTPGAGGTRGFYQVGASFINGGSGVGGTFAGRTQ